MINKMKINNKWRVKIVEPEDCDWNELISRVNSDVYHTQEYLRACTVEEEGEIKVIIFKNNCHTIGMPLLIRKLCFENNYKDAASPYGYPCVIGDIETFEAWQSVWNEMKGFFSEYGLVSAFLRFHPLLTSSFCLEAASAFCDLIYHGETVYQNIDVSEDVLWSETRPSIRYDINKLKRGPWRYVPDDWDLLESFCKNYEMTMRRVGADKKYYFSKQYFDRLGEMRKHGSVSLHTIIDADGISVTSGLFFRREGIVQYHLGATNDLYLRYAPTKLLLNEVRLWYGSRNAKIIHYGGGIGGQNDSLFKFKSGFSKKRAKYYTGQMIADEKKYCEMVEKNLITLERAGEKPKDNYFPAYRAPGVCMSEV
jgi:hypothetical protein